jgi:superfamily II DNA/RNA helicase
MVATDIAARGIHVDGIDLVIHADSATEHKAYLHRSGRTARPAPPGTVITLQTSAQAGAVPAIMRKARAAAAADPCAPDRGTLPDQDPWPGSDHKAPVEACDTWRGERRHERGRSDRHAHVHQLFG